MTWWHNYALAKYVLFIEPTLYGKEQAPIKNYTTFIPTPHLVL